MRLPSVKRMAFLSIRSSIIVQLLDINNKINKNQALHQLLLIKRVLVVIMYMLDPSDGKRTFDLICLGSLEPPSFTLWFFLNLKESISLFYSLYFCFFRQYSLLKLSLISCLIESYIFLRNSSAAESFLISMTSCLSSIELLLIVDFQSLMMSLPLCVFCLYRSCVLMAVSLLLRRYWCSLLAEPSRTICIFAYF